MTNEPIPKKIRFNTGFLNKIKLPKGFEGNRKKKIDSGDLVELLVTYCSSRLTYNLLTLEPEFDKLTIILDRLSISGKIISVLSYG